MTVTLPQLRYFADVEFGLVVFSILISIAGRARNALFLLDRANRPYSTKASIGGCHGWPVLLILRLAIFLFCPFPSPSFRMISAFYLLPKPSAWSPLQSDSCNVDSFQKHPHHHAANIHVHVLSRAGTGPCCRESFPRPSMVWPFGLYVPLCALRSAGCCRHGYPQPGHFLAA